VAKAKIVGWKQKDYGYRVAVAYHGRKWIHAVVIEPRVVVKKVPVSEAKHMFDLPEGGLDTLKGIIRRHGATERAKAIIRMAEEDRCSATHTPQTS
jgi:hypothetical protein